MKFFSLTQNSWMAHAQWKFSQKWWTIFTFLDWTEFARIFATGNIEFGAFTYVLWTVCRKRCVCVYRRPTCEAWLCRCVSMANLWCRVLLCVQREHNELLLKLEFVRDLSSSIIQIARSRSSPLAESVFVDDVCCAGSTAGTVVALASDTGSAVFVGEGQRRIEQLVLYMRALELLASALNLAKTALADGRLSPTMLTRQGTIIVCLIVC